MTAKLRRIMTSASTARWSSLARTNTADLVVVGCFENESCELPTASKELQEALAIAVKRRGFDGSSKRVTEESLDRGRRGLAVVGLGGREGLDAQKFAEWLDRALSLGRQHGARKLAIVFPEHDEARGGAAAGRALGRAALSGYRFDTYQKTKAAKGKREVLVVPPVGEERAYRAAVRRRTGIDAGVVLARDLGNTPPNVATPAWMASRARALARETGMKARVLGVPELKKRKMGGILAVGGGSKNPPRLVRLEGGSRGPKVALVGKGVTFDTGGISIKPAAAMDEMKYDKCGACTVLGIVRAVASLDLPVQLRAYLPLAENMPSATAYRPGDIVRCYNGKTVEILNTDAEGRMILADALSWAAEEKPDYILEYSTLTGAAVVALGEFAAALYCSDDQVSAGLLEAADNSGERLWRMPLWPEYVEQMRGNHADLRNSGARWGGVNTAAAFLSQFVGGHPRWAYIDIAGPAMATNPKGASGYGVDFTVGWLEALAKRKKGA